MKKRTAIKPAFNFQLLIFNFLLLFLIPLTRAQNQCAIADAVTFPVDTSVFRLVQDFGAPSPRHQGRYHTGEDWYGGRDASLGQPVRAIANGRVTYSSPGGWGRDKGVVIIEHTFPDGTIAYSQYGHMEANAAANFPPQYACVSIGEVIGAVGNVRPAPHVHFEIRESDGSSPGPGYDWVNPESDGFRRPSKFVFNWQTWLQPAYGWRLDLADESGPAAPPLRLDDASLIYLDAGRLGRVTPDGRSLWRINLEKPAAGVTALDGEIVLVYGDGTMQLINLDGSLGERWETGVYLDGSPMNAGEMVLFHAPNDVLIAFGTDLQAPLWRLEEVPPIVRAQAAGQVIGLITESDELLTISYSGQLLDRAQLRDLGSMATLPDGTLMAYTLGGLWTINNEGVWAAVMENAPFSSRAGSMAVGTDGGLYLFDGRGLRAYDANQNARWLADLPGVTGISELREYGEALLLTSNHGNIIAVQKSTGAVCGLAQIYGNNRSGLWHHLGDDGTLRIFIADQILGLDWQEFLGGCAG
jgi:murein DD-endopeptidase MepM/ murein hydrolase activator NlpD